MTTAQRLKRQRELAAWKPRPFALELWAAMKWDAEHKMRHFDKRPEDANKQRIRETNRAYR